MQKIYAEDVGHYWRTGTSSPDTWIDKARREIAAANGEVLGEAFGRDEMGRAAFLLEFSFDGERFRIVWPVLESRTGNEKAARIQAATFLYHDVKARCMAAKVLGKRAAFFNYLLLPDGRTAAQLAAPELVNLYPKMLTAGVSDE
jgi:hypothetical protein